MMSAAAATSSLPKEGNNGVSSDAASAILKPLRASSTGLADFYDDVLKQIIGFKPFISQEFWITQMVLCCGFLLPNSTSRMKYLFLILLGGITAAITKSVSASTDSSVHNSKLTWAAQVCFVMALFFSVLGSALLLLRMKKKQRASLHHGFWSCKFFLLIGTIVGLSFIPQDHLEVINDVSYYSGLVGGFIFISIQLILIHEFIVRSLSPWLKQKEESNVRFRPFFLVVSRLLFLLSFGAAGYLIVYVCSLQHLRRDVPSDVPVTMFFVFLILSVFVSIPSLPIWDTILDHMSSCLLMSTVILSYNSLITWSAMSNAASGYMNSTTIDRSETLEIPAPQDNGDWSFDTYIRLVIQLIVLFVSLIYLSTRQGVRQLLAQPTVEPHQPVIKNDPSIPVIVVINFEEEVSDDDDVDIGDGDLDYSWPGFHFVVSLACLYLLMILVDLSTFNSMDHAATMSQNNLFTLKFISLVVQFVSSLCFPIFWQFIYT